MGEVYLAQDTELDRKVALKILPAELAVSQDRMRRFVQEAKAAAALNHPNVAHIYEIGERDGLNFIAMEYVDGKTLREKIHYESNELRKLIKYLQQVAGGLAKAHAAGIVHRDLKPDNIMITRDGYAKILDFGLAKLIEIPRFGAEGETVSDADTVAQVQYSIPGRLMGTVGYMSPEQAQGKIGAIDHRSDIFSFGCMLYEAATKHCPFEGESNVQSLYKIVYEPAPQIKDFDPSASPALQRVIRRCLAKDPDERYQSIQDIALELKELRRDMEGDTRFDDTATSARQTSSASAQPTSSTRPTSSAEYITTEIKRHKKGAILIASLATVAIAASILFLHFRSARALTEKDTILLTDFVNTTGDSVFDGTLKQALAVQLGQSPFLNIFSEDRMREALKFMGRSPDERVTRDVGREICQRQGLKAMLVGSIASLGNHYVITLEAINAQTGEAIPSLKRATEIDPNFALAYARMASMYYNSRQYDLAAEASQKAFELRDRVSERERLYISAGYYDNVTGELEKYLETLELWKRTYPRDASPPNNLAVKYNELGQFDKALEAASEAIRLNPGSASGYSLLAVAFVGLNRFDEAKEIIGQAQAQKLETTPMRRTLYRIAFVQGDATTMQQQIEWLKGKPDEYVGQGWQSETAAFSGQLKKAQEFSNRAVALAAA